MSEYRFGSARFDVPGGTSMGLGLGGVNDYSSPVFIDFFKHARSFGADVGGTWNAIKIDELKSGGYVDANGWPISVPPGATKFVTYWLVNDSGRVFADPFDGWAFVMTWEGEGSVNLAEVGLTITSQTANRIEFTLDASQNVSRNIEAIPTNPANYLRNFKIIPAQYQSLYDAGEIFLPEYVANVQGARCLRFMDMLGTNNSTVSTWAERTVLASASWSAFQQQNHVPFEACASLCNKIGADGWFCIPHLADNDYITQLATLIRDTLNPGLKAYFEYSNETWNWIFDQADYCLAQGEAEFGVIASGIERDWHAKRSTQMAQIIRPIWKDRWQDCRIVMATQTETTAVATGRLNPTRWATAEPETYEPPADWHDCLGVTGYYGDQLNADNPTGVAEYKGWYDADPATAHANMIQHLQDEIDNTLIPDLAANKAIADQYGLSMVAYEANSHALFGTLGGAGEEAYLAAAIATLTSQDAADKHEIMLDAWKAAGGELLCWFVNIAPHTVSGVWGAIEYLGETRPVDTTVRAWFAANPRWWDEPGRFHAYAPGERMTGEITFRVGERISGSDVWRAGPTIVTVTGEAAPVGLTWAAQSLTIWTGA